MAYGRAERPLDPNAVAIANQQLWSQFPELKGRQLTPDDDEKYRSYWMDQYEKAGGTVQKPKPLPPKAPTQPCPLQKCITRITAVVPGTNGKRDASKTRPNDTLRASSSKDESLSSNPPVPCRCFSYHPPEHRQAAQIDFGRERIRDRGCVRQRRCAEFHSRAR